MAQTSFETQPDGSFPLGHFIDEVVKDKAFPGATLTDIFTEAQILTTMGTPGFSKVGRGIMLTAEGRRELEGILEGFSDPGAVREDRTGMLFNRRSPDLPWDESQQIEPISLGEGEIGFGLRSGGPIGVESIPWEVDQEEALLRPSRVTSIPHLDLQESGVFGIDLERDIALSSRKDSTPPSPFSLEEQLVHTHGSTEKEMRVIFPEGRGPAVAVPAFLKSGERVVPRENSSNGARTWPFPPMHLGAFFHHLIENELVPEGPRISMKDYLLHLDVVGNHHRVRQGEEDSSNSQRLIEVGLARLVLEKATNLSQQVAEEIRQQLPDGFSATAWLKEVPFVLPNSQSEIIARSLEDKDLQDFAATVFDADLFQLGEKVISSPDPRFVIRDGRGSKEVTLSDIYEIARQSENTEKASYLDQLYEYLGAISGYYMINNTGLLGGANIPEPLKKLILCASARCDLIGLMGRESRGQGKIEELIAEYVERTRGRLFGWRPLHDFVHASEEAIDVQRRLIRAIMNGEVALWLGEIKSSLTGQGGEIDFYGDLAHTVFAAFQNLTRGLNHPTSVADRLSSLLPFGSRGHGSGGFRPELLNQLMTAATPMESEAILMKLRPLMSMLEPPNAVFGVEINWPVVDSDLTESKPLFGLDPSRVAEINPEWRVLLLDPRELRRRVAEKGNDFLERLIEV